MAAMSSDLSMATNRSVVRVHRGRPTRDGGGVHLTRVIGTPELEMLDPFLMLDEFGSDNPDEYLAGFPDHPHRGFETVTYMLAGRMRHQDNQGYSGVIGPGGVQWMTAGRGLIHRETPEQSEGLMRGFQLWLNLPADRKMDPPRYQDLDAREIPEVSLDGGGLVRVIAGQFGDQVEGAVREIVTDPIYWDVHLPTGSSLVESIPNEHAAFLYVYEGHIEVIGSPDSPTQSLPECSLGVLGEGARLELRATERPARLLVLAAAPLKEPVARRGPFVMNTSEQIHQAIRDYQEGRF